MKYSITVSRLDNRTEPNVIKRMHGWFQKKDSDSFFFALQTALSDYLSSKSNSENAQKSTFDFDKIEINIIDNEK